MRQLYISDYHLGHDNCLRFDNRPFESAEEMTETVIALWNGVVCPDDTVYILGDFAWNADVGEKTAARLRGNKVLIKGNHDRISPAMEKHFSMIVPYLEIKDNGRHVVLCHYPIAHWNRADYGAVHLYGHIHQSRDSEPFEAYKAQMKQREQPYECYNVGCMLPYMAYTPRTLDEITAGATRSDHAP